MAPIWRDSRFMNGDPIAVIVVAHKMCLYEGRDTACPSKWYWGNKKKDNRIEQNISIDTSLLQLHIFICMYLSIFFKNKRIKIDLYISTKCRIHTSLFNLGVHCLLIVFQFPCQCMVVSNWTVCILLTREIMSLGS